MSSFSCSSSSTSSLYLQQYRFKRQQYRFKRQQQRHAVSRSGNLLMTAVHAPVQAVPSAKVKACAMALPSQELAACSGG